VGLEVCVVGGRERVDGGVVLGDIILDSVGVLDDAVRTRCGCLCVCAYVTGLSARKCQLCIGILSLSHRLQELCGATRSLMVCKHILASLSQQGTNDNVMFGMSFQYTRRKLQQYGVHRDDRLLCERTLKHEIQKV
jgi:hypothetical protein